MGLDFWLKFESATNINFHMNHNSALSCPARHLTPAVGRLLINMMSTSARSRRIRAILSFPPTPPTRKGTRGRPAPPKPMHWWSPKYFIPAEETSEHETNLELDDDTFSWFISSLFCSAEVEAQSHQSILRSKLNDDQILSLQSSHSWAHISPEVFSPHYLIEIADREKEPPNSPTEAR